MRLSFRFVLVAALVVIGSTVADATEVVSLAPSSTGLELELGSDEIIHLRVSELRLDRVEIDGAEWALVRAPGAQNSMDRGLPSLPYLTSRYLLDRSDGISLELVSRRVRTIDLSQYDLAGVVPSKGHFNRETDPESVPWAFDAKAYSSNLAFPAADSRVDDPFISGPVRGQSMQIPVVFWQAETNTLTVVEEAWFRVVHAAEAANPRLGPDRPRTGLFESAIWNNSLNAETFAGRSNPFVEVGQLLIIADDDFVDEVQPLADWENQVGFPTMLVPVSTIGSTAAEIKGYIQFLYDAPGSLTWIILVGDADQIPTLTGVNEGADCDACYTKLEGADNRPDAAISRLSAQTGEQVTAQVSKILDYERYPDAGSEGAWYAKGFGIASNEGSPPDYERMNWLRDDLMSPAYVYTEFDQIYDPGASASQVTAAVNAGRSLGLYIGHGSKSSWSTTGFGVSQIPNLTNAGTYPTVWSVACVNGDFVGGSDCFAEAFLKKEGAGAVSFEGATTNESWVPPCIAQRGIVDSIRLETAFTTGGQHMAGKHAIMDEYGDSNLSEGNKWVEQSTLFGVATMWPRTLPAVAPDEPDDFVVAGGTATLTVKMGGAPFAKVGGAIVSFYDETGGVNVLGSGLIDGNGVVSAEVTGPPTHCHIHGINLIPTSFELQIFDALQVFADDFETGDCTMWTTAVGEN